MGNIFYKAFVFIAIALVGISCYAFFWKQSTDCSKELNCVELTTALIDAEKREIMGAQKIKELAKTYGFKFKDYHQDGKASPFEIGKNVFFDEGDGGIFLISKDRSKRPYDHLERIGSSEYQGGVGYFLISEDNFKKIDNKNKSDITQYLGGLLFVISEPGHILIDYQTRTVLFITTDYWDVAHRLKKFPWLKDKQSDQCGFRKGERVLPPC